MNELLKTVILILIIILMIIWGSFASYYLFKLIKEEIRERKDD